ncbi:hypothetical protein MB27_29135 [Actinoplanes utahensis]|uniref:Uncharacterized protein n=1 Tax=Actinoplanes utahensis TaxID=1869 RepID=A0A0A6UFY5_ACTUT|nr:hypothetical protein MB27_29135 [Actinoplanes utahensis]
MSSVPTNKRSHLRHIAGSCRIISEHQGLCPFLADRDDASKAVNGASSCSVILVIEVFWIGAAPVTK